MKDNFFKFGAGHSTCHRPQPARKSGVESTKFAHLNKSEIFKSGPARIKTQAIYWVGEGNKKPPKFQRKAVSTVKVCLLTMNPWEWTVPATSGPRTCRMGPELATEIDFMENASSQPYHMLLQETIRKALCLMGIFYMTAKVWGKRAYQTKSTQLCRIYGSTREDVTKDWSYIIRSFTIARITKSRMLRSVRHSKRIKDMP